MALSMEAKAAVLADNLSKRLKQNKEGEELRLTYLADLAHLFADRIRSATDASVPFQAAMADAAEAYRSHLLQNGVDGAQFCALLSKEMRAYLKELCAMLFPLQSEVGKSISYVSHRTADLAFSVLSERFQGISVSYADDMREACGALIGGECEYCLLPIENEGVALQSTRTLLQNSGLYTVMSVHADDIRYLLLSRSLLVHSFECEPLYMSISLPIEHLENTVTLISLLKEEISEIYSFTLGEKNKVLLSFTLGSEASFTSALLYFAIIHKDIEITGFYQKLEE